ncbi:MAG: histidine--tRNA ligase [Chitinophagaceae bacterium]|nr:MAG: histidine--tRNA ligase [Chitinophagaceae bacterium]
MAKVNVSLPQGTRDFPPDVVRKRNYILGCIRSVFEAYGFEPLETPAMENLSTLMGKYGEEGDKLIFKILNNGLGDPKNIDKSRTAFEQALQGRNEKDLTERALKYDLTIPFARFVAMNHTILTFPFKRYQVQPVWRADRPQRGRYREFYQCDADVVGSRSLLNEVELLFIYHTAFTNLGVRVEIKVNSRKILAALAETIGAEDRLTDMTVAIDKLDKIGMDKVAEELSGKGFAENQVNLVREFLSIHGDNQHKLNSLRELLGVSPIGAEGITELETLLHYPGVEKAAPVLDLTLARGLNYYTGAIFEVKALDVTMGSIGGGGRYDDLTGLFGVNDIPGVGISFGVDRIYDVMDELKLFPENLLSTSKILFFNLGETESRQAFQLLQQLRATGISGEIYPENVKFDKQFKYATKKNIPFIAIIGEKEMEEQVVTVKDLRTSTQSSISWNKLAAFNFD